MHTIKIPEMKTGAEVAKRIRRVIVRIQVEEAIVGIGVIATADIGHART